MERIKKLFSSIIPVPVPAELKEQFDDIQLKNSLYRIRVLSLTAVLYKLTHGIISFFVNDHLKIEVLLNLRESIELAIIVLFNIAVVSFNKRGKKSILWLFCYLYVALSYCLYSFDMRSLNLLSVLHVPVTFSIIFILFTLAPDFKPKIFLSFGFLFLFSTMGVINATMVHNNIAIGMSFPLQSFILNIFFIILCTKILHYNNVVKTFTNTFEIERQVKEKTKTIVDLKYAVMETMADLVERRDNTTGGHISRTSRFLETTINAMIKKGIHLEKTTSMDTNQIIKSAQLHDVGKIAIDDSILRKPGKLDDNEFEEMKKHTVYGGEIIKEIQNKTEESEYLEYAYTFAVYHHEKWDGTGYPFGIAGENIPLPARLMAIIDVYDALISERPYKKAFTHEEAIKIIKEGKGTHFDPVITDLFLSVSDQLISI